MAIKARRGNYDDFDMDKMEAGELAIVIGGDPNAASGKSIYFTVAPGDCRRLMTREDLTNEMQSAVGELSEQLLREINGVLAVIEADERNRVSAEKVREAAEAKRQHDSTKAINDIRAAQKTVEDKLAAGEFVGPKGDKGDVQYATFDVMDGDLMMYNAPEMTHTDFRLLDGDLLVEVNG